MSTRKSSAERRAAVERMRAQEARAERRRSVLIIGGAAAVGVVLVGVAALATVNEQRREDAERTAAAAPIDGVQDFPDLSRNHVTGPVDYAQTPPTGGDHDGVWVNCGAYTEPVQDTQAVHSLEHGAVWITYRPDLAPDQVGSLGDIAEDNGFVLVSPFEGLESPVVASAWGKQLALDGVEDPRLDQFVSQFAQGPQTPEPGAPCTGGVGGA